MVLVAQEDFLNPAVTVRHGLLCSACGRYYCVYNTTGSNSVQSLVIIAAMSYRGRIRQDPSVHILRKFAMETRPKTFQIDCVTDGVGASFSYILRFYLYYSRLSREELMRACRP
jgi:hypothetical protein